MKKIKKSSRKRMEARNNKRIKHARRSAVAVAQIRRILKTHGVG